MTIRNKILKHYSNKIMDYRDLKQYVTHLVKGGSSLIYQAHLSAKEKTKVPPLLKEIERLKAQLAAQQAEESTVGKHALSLYAENEVLRQYKSLSDGEMHNFVHVDDHAALKKEYATAKEKLAIVSKSLQDFQEQFEAYLRANRSAPVGNLKLAPKPGA